MEKPLDVSFVPYTPKLVEQDQTIEFRLELQPAVPLVNTALEKYAHRHLMCVFSFGICVFGLFQDGSFVVYDCWWKVLNGCCFVFDVECQS